MKRIVLRDAESDGAQGHTRTPESQEHRTSTPEPQGQRTATPALPRHQQPLPPELMEIVVPALRVGAVAGTCGLFAGAAAGIIRSAPTVFFSVITGGQWFTLASSYYGTRLAAFNYLGGEAALSPRDKTKASAVAGGVAGSLGGLLRGPRNILPGALVFSLFGAGGQGIANWRAARAANTPPSSGKGFWEKYSPFTRLSDQDYEKILEERLLRVEVEIALIDDHIKELRESEKQTKDEATGSEKSSPAAAPSPKD